MSAASVELLSANFQASPIFARLPKFETAFFRGELKPKVLHFEAEQGGEKVHILSATVIRHEEAFIWESCKELIEHTVKTAALEMQGIFGFEVLSIDMKGIEQFSWADLSRLLINHSKRLANGQSRLVQYGSLFGILTKRVAETWGKIDLKTYVDVFEENGSVGTFVKRILKAGSSLGGPLLVAVIDLSTQPLMNGEKVPVLKTDLGGGEDALPPEIYWIHRARVWEINEFGAGS